MSISVSNKPVLMITMGDAAGIGPEVALKALAVPEVQALARFFIIGDYNYLDRTRRFLRLDLKLVRVKYDRSSTDEFNRIAAGTGAAAGDIMCLDLANLPSGGWRPGRPHKVCGQAAVEYIKTAARLALTAGVKSIVTGPISKEAVHQAGYNWPGHTEFLSDTAGVKDFAMMLIGGGLRVVLATTHLSLDEVSRNLSRDLILKKLKLTHNWLDRYFGIDRPRIAVCGLNPHAGESGAFGTEEARFIRPAVYEAQKENIDVTGPLPADTVFYQALKQRFDVVLAMYHDQGLGPLKLIAFEEGVNVTLGLPFIRTSPDHGTAFDLVGQARASSRSMEQAIITAVSMFQYRYSKVKTSNGRKED